MADVNDMRVKAEAWDGGSSKLAVWLDAADAQAIFDDASATDGWYMPSYQQQTEVGPDRDSEEVKDEADNLIKTRVNRDEFVVVTTFFQSTSSLIRLIEHLEESANATKLRYPMPTDVDTISQWVLMYSVTVRKENWASCKRTGPRSSSNVCGIEKCRR